MKTSATISGLMMTLLASCNAQQQAAAPVAAEQAVAAQANAVQPSDTIPPIAQAAPAVEHDCAGGDSELQHDVTRTFTDAQGRQVTHTGRDFSAVETVSVAELLASPDKYAGKSVKVAGDVSAMCGHKRAWFALTADDQSGRSLRVLTNPVFLVPAGSIGKTAIAEGTVEVITVAADHARHIADEHKLGDPAEIKQDVKQVVLRASGADFI